MVVISPLPSPSPKKETSPTPPKEKTTPTSPPPLSEQSSESVIEPELFGNQIAPIASKSDAAEKNFDAFWQTYPKKNGKEAAKKKFIAAVRKGVNPEHIIAASKRHADAHRLACTDDQYIVWASVWLNQGRYDDEVLPKPKPPRREVPVDEIWFNA